MRLVSWRTLPSPTVLGLLYKPFFQMATDRIHSTAVYHRSCRCGDLVPSQRSVVVDGGIDESMTDDVLIKGNMARQANLDSEIRRPGGRTAGP